MSEVLRNIQTVAAEIRAIKEQAQRMILDSAIELGRRLCEAKEMLEYGEWGRWLQEEVTFSKSTANNLMRVFEEYGDAQGSLFGATAKSQTLGSLTYSKAVALLAVPSDEREEFVGEHNVGELSTRELERVIKERDEAIAAKEAAEARAGEIEALEAELEALRRAGATAPPPSAAPLQGGEFAEAEKKLKAKIDAAKEAQAAAEAARDAALREREAAAEKSERLEKRLAAASDETVTVFKVNFESAQECINRMLGCVAKPGDEGRRDKLRAALRALCEKTLAGLEG